MDQRSKKSENDGQDAKLADSFFIETRRSQNVSNFFEETKQEYQSMHVGQSFERYTIQGELGRGGMGIVYKAFDTQLKRTVALKVILKGEEKDIQRFERESSAMAQLDHNNIVKLYDFGTSPQPFFTMEYIEGFTLADLIKEKKVKPLFLLDLLIKVCDALAHAHQNKILHRDIKPSNIMITKDGEPKIMDFGLAKIFESNEKTLSRTGDILGSVNYMSPEQLNGKTTERSDIYSLGATMYEALTYRNVYQGDSHHDILFQLLQNDPIPPRRLNPTLSPYFEAICLKCIAKKEQKRYRDFKQLVRELKNFKAHKPIIAKKYTSWNAFTKFICRHKIKFSVIAFGVVMLCTSLIFAVYAWKKSEKANQHNQEVLNLTTDALEYVMFRYKQLQTDKKLGQLFTKILAYKEKYGGSENWDFLQGYVASMNFTNEKSIAYFDREITKNPNNALAYNHRGNVYFALGNYKKALADYNKAIEIQPGNYFAYNSRGTYYRFFEKYDKAFDNYNKAIDLKPKHAAAYANRGSLYYLQKKYTKALDDFNLAVRFDSKNAASYAKRGIIYYELKKYDKALRDLNKAISLDPNSFLAYNYRGIFYKGRGKYAKAIADFTHVIRVAPKLTVGYENRGAIYFQVQEFEKAIADFNTVISLRHIAKDYLARAACFGSLQKNKQALADYNMALSLGAKRAEVYPLRGVVYFYLGQYEEALSDFNKAIALHKNSNNIYHYRGRTNYRLKNHKEALLDFGKAIELDTNPNTYYRRGILYYALEQYEKALADFNKTIYLDRNSDFSVFNRRGMTYYQMKNYEKALVDFKKAKALKPDFKDVYWSLGSVYFQLQKYQQAIWEYQHVLDTPQGNYGLYRCYQELNNDSKAQYHLKKSEELRKQSK